MVLGAGCRCSWGDDGIQLGADTILKFANGGQVLALVLPSVEVQLPDIVEVTLDAPGYVAREVSSRRLAGLVNVVVDVLRRQHSSS